MFKTWLYDFCELGDLDFVYDWKYEEGKFEIKGRWRYKGVFFDVTIWGDVKETPSKFESVEDILEVEWKEYFIDINDDLDKIEFDDYLLKEIEEYEKGEREIDEDDHLMLIFEHAEPDGWWDLCPILLEKLKRDFPNTYKKVKKILDKWKEKD